MIQLELFPEPIPDTPVASVHFWDWLDKLTDPSTKEISFRDLDMGQVVICNLAEHTVRMETINV